MSWDTHLSHPSLEASAAAQAPTRLGSRAAHIHIYIYSINPSPNTLTSTCFICNTLPQYKSIVHSTMPKQRQKPPGSLGDDTLPERLSMVFHKDGSSDLTVPEDEMTLRDAIDSLKAGLYTSFAVFTPASESFAKSRLTVSEDLNRITGVQQDSLSPPRRPCFGSGFPNRGDLD